MFPAYYWHICSLATGFLAGLSLLAMLNHLFVPNTAICGLFTAIVVSLRLPDLSGLDCLLHLRWVADGAIITILLVFVLSVTIRLLEKMNNGCPQPH